MQPQYVNLQSLLDGDAQAREYFNRLPDYVKEHIRTRDHNVNSLESLQTYANNLLAGDD